MGHIRKWLDSEKQLVFQMLNDGCTYKEVSEKIDRSPDTIYALNKKLWGISVLKSFRKKHPWSGKNNPNYGAKIVKRGDENPLSIWKSQNPGYQDGEKNPMYGRVLSPEEIARKTARMVSLSHQRKGKTYKEFYGEEKSAEISKAMSQGSVIRISQQKDKDTSIEKKMKLILNSLEIQYEFQYPLDFYCVDFFIPSLKLIIQTDGCYWHGCPKHFIELDDRQKNRVRLDHSCDSFLKNKGYKLFRVWECEMDNIDIKSQIKSFTEEEL